jgi:hypothetical protein
MPENVRAHSIDYAIEWSAYDLASVPQWPACRPNDAPKTLHVTHHLPSRMTSGLRRHHCVEKLWLAKEQGTQMARSNDHHNHGHHYRQADIGLPIPAAAIAAEVSAAPAVLDFAELGATFNDATRALVGGLWQNVVEEGGQGHGSVVRYTDDLTTVQSGLQAGVDAQQFSGVALSHVQTMLSDITTALSAAAASVDGGGTFGSVANAEEALRTSHLNILNMVNSDPDLKALATQDNASGFMATPATLPDGITAGTAPHANLAEIGAIFNDAASRILGGVNAENASVISNDVNTVMTELQGLIKANPSLFGGLTGIHADAIVRQLQLEDTYIAQAGVSPDAGRASNDNILDIIDIVQGDTNLANMATQGGVSGFSPFPESLNETPKYLDNEAQTAFWANFIAQSNSLGQRAVATVDAHDRQAITALVSDLHAFQNNVTNFDAAQGGIFGARFDNELLGKTSTLGAEVTAMIKGLHTGNAALVAAAAEQMHANSADVGGNNTPVTGGAYNPDGLTIEEVLSTASAAPAVVAAPAAQTSTSAAAASPQPDPGTHAAGNETTVDPHHSPHHEIFQQQLHHVWG